MLPPGVAPGSYSFAFPISARAGNGEIMQVGISSELGVSNWLEVANVKPIPVGVNVEIYNQAGQLLEIETLNIPAFSQVHLNVSSKLASESFGFARVIPEEAESIIGQSMFYFRDLSTGSVEAMFGSMLREAYGLNNFGSYNLFLGMENRLKITNVSNSTQNFGLTVKNRFGADYGQTHSFQPNESREFLLHDFSTYLTSPNTYGVLELESDSRGELIGEILRLRPETTTSIDFLSPTSVR